MKKFPKIFIRISLILVTSLFLFNCSNESHDDNITMDTLDSQSDNLKTVPLENSLNFLKKLNSDRLTNRGLISNDIGLKIDAESLEQVDITNTDAKLNIASATTKFEGVETEFLQIEIDGELQTILFHHIPEKNITMTSRRPIDDKNFTGDVYSTDLDGRVLSGFRINKGTISGSYNPSPYATDPIKLNEVIIKNTYVAPPYGGNYTTMLNYGFVRPQSMNNYSSMGLAYAAYYRHLQTKKIDDEINDGLLKPCLKKILDNLKKTTASPGNMIVNFTGNWANGYNWTMKDGFLNGSIAETDPIYNETRGMTTTFDTQSWKDATDLSWARTMLHESIHAYLVTYFKLDRPGWIATYPEMVNDWGVKQNWNAVHHEEIARSLVNSIGSALEVYGVSQGYNLTKQFYQDMAWAGLQTTDAFKALPSSEQKRILDTILTELTGKDSNEEVKTQKGKKAGC
jgi:hypothetical protein